MLAFDIQPQAIRQTQELLETEGLTNARLLLDSHSNMERYAEQASVDCIVFNFGRAAGWKPGNFYNRGNFNPGN